jgi:hypothetical protein
MSLTSSGADAKLGLALLSLLYLGIHALALLISMVVAFIRGKSAKAMSYFAALGMVLTIGGGACVWAVT